MSWSARLHELFKRDPFCCYCGVKTSLGGVGYNASTVEHLHPVSCGGAKRSEKNTVLACRYCNGRRGNMPMAEWLTSDVLRKRLLVTQKWIKYGWSVRRNVRERFVEFQKGAKSA